MGIQMKQKKLIHGDFKLKKTLFFHDLYKNIPAL